MHLFDYPRPPAARPPSALAVLSAARNFLIAALLAIVMAPVTSVVHAATVPHGTKPQMLYRIGTGASNTGTMFTSIGAVYAFAQSQLPEGPNRTWGGISTVSDSGTVNGIPSLQRGVYQVRQSETAPWYESDVVFVTEYECGEGMTAKVTASGSNQTVTCMPPPPASPPVTGPPETPPPCGCTPQEEGGSSSSSPDTPSLGDPILPSTGIVEEREVDYADNGVSNLTFTRLYRSDSPGWKHNFMATASNLSDPLSADKSVVVQLGAVTGQVRTFARLSTGDNYDIVYSGRRGELLALGGKITLDPLPSNIVRRVGPLYNGGVRVGLEVWTARTGTTEQFNLNGQLTKLTTRSGLSQTFTYSDATTLPAIAPAPGLLIKVTDHFGRQLTFTYDTIEGVGPVMSTMTDPMGGVTRYVYDESTSIVMPNRPAIGNLTSVIHSDGTVRRYWYNEQSQTGGVDMPYSLTGIVDENGTRAATFTYEGGKAVATEQAGGVNKYTVTYSAPFSDATDPLGTLRRYRFQNVMGDVLLSGVTEPAPTGTGTVTRRIYYDANGNVDYRTDFKGVKTTYTYDMDTNLELSRVEAAGTAVERTISTQWDTVLRLPTKSAEPKRLTTMTYSTAGKVLTKKIQATSDADGSLGFSAPLLGTPQIWKYEYNTIGQLKKVTGPRTDVADVTQFDYNVATGNLVSITNALGQITTLSEYDQRGKPGRVQTPDGVIRRMTYTQRGQLETQTVTDGVTSQVTSYLYDSTGLMEKVTLPDQTTVSYAYDLAGRLTDVYDARGNSIHYVRDNMGNSTSEEVKDPNGYLVRQSTRVFDALSRLKQVIGVAQ